MYAALFVWFPAGSLMLGSWWTALACILPIALLGVRAALEDRYLHRDLPGYPEYAARVRFRLLPGVW
jgi:protein-S-isoprenylcysteine O-methyltransferase Ste14